MRFPQLASRWLGFVFSWCHPSHTNSERAKQTNQAININQTKPSARQTDKQPCQTEMNPNKQTQTLQPSKQTDEQASPFFRTPVAPAMSSKRKNRDSQVSHLKEVWTFPLVFCVLYNLFCSLLVRGSVVFFAFWYSCLWFWVLPVVIVTLAVVLMSCSSPCLCCCEADLRCWL